MAQKKSNNSTKFAPKIQLVTNERTNPVLQPKVYEHKGKDMGGQFFPGLYAFSLWPRIISLGVRTKSLGPKVKHGGYT